jgi:hypothetical protein
MCNQGYAEHRTADIFHQTFQACINLVICCRLNGSQQQQWMILAKHNILLLILDFISASNHFRIWWKYSLFILFCIQMNCTDIRLAFISIFLNPCQGYPHVHPPFLQYISNIWKLQLPKSPTILLWHVKLITSYTVRGFCVYSHSFWHFTF